MSSYNILTTFAGLHLKKKLMYAGSLNLMALNIALIIFVEVDDNFRLLCICNALFWIANLVYNHFSKNVDHPYVAMTIYGLLSIFVHAYLKGGFYSSYMFWLPLMSLGMSIFLNKFYAILCIVFSTITYTLFLYLQLSGKADFQEELKQVPPLLDYINFMSVLVMLCLIHYFFFTKENLDLIWKRESEMKVGDLQSKLSQKETEVEKMRTNMAQDFHDEMGNKLASISILTQSLDLKLRQELSRTSVEEFKILEIIHQTVLEVYDGTKDFIWSVDHRSDYLLELFIYVREFGERFFNNLEINFKSEYNADTSIPYRLPPLCGRQLILVCKEIMTNAAKHSKCQEFTLKIDVASDTLRIIFSDNGTGFDQNYIKRRNGLRNIEERSISFCKNFSMESSPSGTRYSLFLDIISSETTHIG
ncbi:sensor histidine kinase [Sporocytophaga myxococcoides]|uniref:sensor histidine kinase n=1 Tax=Sporocytophaga myxococcoides TaxID=153721 RepID=UPI0003F60743|nr:ATP-binding protein [Sporocytophaga myxococcoides]